MKNHLLSNTFFNNFYLLIQKKCNYNQQQYYKRCYIFCKSLIECFFENIEITISDTPETTRHTPIMTEAVDITSNGFKSTIIDTTVSNNGTTNNPRPVFCDQNSDSTTNSWNNEKPNNANANSITKNSRNETGNNINNTPKTTEPIFITDITYLGNAAYFFRAIYRFSNENDAGKKNTTPNRRTKKGMALSLREINNTPTSVTRTPRSKSLIIFSKYQYITLTSKKIFWYICK